METVNYNSLKSH